MAKQIFSMLTLATLCSLSMLTACDDDDDDAGSSVYKADATVLTTADGDKLLVTKCGDYTYTYDDNGNLTAINNFVVTTNPFTLVHKYSNSTYDSLYVTTNSNGYISEIYRDWNYYDYIEKDNFTYDGSGHLTKITSIGYDTEDMEDEPDSDTYSITWSDGVITKIYNDYGDEEDYMTITYEYDDEEYYNATKQYCPTIFKECSGEQSETLELVSMFAYIGLLGVGPDYLPTSWSWYVYDSGYEDEAGYNCSYSFNDDGSIDYWKGISSGYIAYDDYPE